MSWSKCWQNKKKKAKISIARQIFSKFKMLSVSVKNHITISIFFIKPSPCPDFLIKSWKMVLKTLPAKVI